jgi:hypothetical protein
MKSQETEETKKEHVCRRVVREECLIFLDLLERLQNEVGLRES